MRITWTLFLLFIMTACGTARQELTWSKPTPASVSPKHEWRAAWIATVNNIDWPSSPGLSSEKQKEELITYLDLFKELNFNAIILQVRPTADALYMPDLEPWSIYLTGHQEKSPDPLYDPLAFAIKEAHARGMELHAWLNPYRVLQDTADIEKMASDHLYFSRPELFVRHGKKLYFDPAYPDTRDFLVKVVKNLVDAYDVDGIHFDDYFYPNNDFEDSVSFARHSRGYKPEDKMAWRRENVNLVIEQLRDTIKATKPYVKFGISPYAVWRNLREDPRGSDTRSFGYTNYDHLHADVLHWMEEGWLDYVLPQLYFNIGYENADFNVLADWWRDYSHGTPVYGGIGTYRLSPEAPLEAWRSVAEIRNQIEMLRSMPAYQGVCYFNAKNFTDNRMDIVSLMRELYPNPALVPHLRGFRTEPPEAPSVAVMVKRDVKNIVSWAHIDYEFDNPYGAKYHAIYRFAENETPDFTNSESLIAITGKDTFEWEGATDGFVYYITALDRLFNESKPVKIAKGPSN